MRLTHIVTTAVLLATVTTVQAQAPTYTHNDTVLALAGSDQQTYCVAFYESGRSGQYDPNSNGDNGESHGLFKLHERGLLPDFYKRGYTNWRSPYQQVAYYREVAQANGTAFLRNNWTPYANCASGARFTVYDYQPELGWYDQ